MARHFTAAFLVKHSVVKFLFALTLFFSALSPGAAWAVQQTIDAGFSHTFLLKSNGDVYAWGGNGNGQFGDGSLTDSVTPRLVLGSSNGFTDIKAGYAVSAGLKGDSMWSWGRNPKGQVGDGATTERWSPVQVSGMLSGVTAISPGWSFTLELQNGSAYAQGRNLENQLGNNTVTESSLPMLVPQITNANAISAATYHGLALQNNGSEVWVWGKNDYGQLGIGSTTNQVPPVQIIGFTNVSAISSNTYHSLALKNDGTVWAWGRNDFGQIGDGTFDPRLTPTQVSGLTGVIAISAGEYHNIALKSNGTVWAWGKNNYGQLGDGTTTTRNTPVQVTGLTNVVAISAGFYHNVALKNDGYVWTWGLNDLGQVYSSAFVGLLGRSDITDTYRSTPVQVNNFQMDITVTATAGTNGTITPLSQTVPYGNTATFTVTPNTGYSAAASGCGGSLNGNIFTTGPITQPCSVTATFTLNSYTVSATGGAGGSVSPSSRVVNHGSTAAFTVTANSGYTTSSTVGGTCPTGIWNGTTYTTGVVTGTCSVSFSFLPLYTVTATAGSNGSITPSSQIVPQGSTTTFSVTPNAGYSILSVTGCNGSLAGSTYTTGVITGPCNVNAQFAAAPSVTTGAVGGINTSGGATLNGTVNPNGASTTVYFEYGTTTSYGSSITAGSGFSGNSTQSVSGTLSGLTCNTIYHYRTKGVNSIGTSYGADATFVACVSETYSDFNGDGKADILWRHATTGNNSMWFMNGVTKTSEGTVNPISDMVWIVAGIGDFNGNGKSDILWRHLNTTDGQVSVWLMNGATKDSSAPVDYITDLNWKVVGIGDFNGDGKSDILWRHFVSGQNVIWFMNGTTRTSSAYTNTISDTTWIVGGVGDFNGDGKADILWRHLNTDGQVSVWLMDGATKVSSAPVEYVTDLDWRVAGVGDFDADGKADILWRHFVNGQNAIWFMNGTTRTSYAYLQTVADTNWKIVEVSDFNGDAMVDILWRHATTGSNTIWLMNGATANGYAIPSMTDLNWKVQPLFGP